MRGRVSRACKNCALSKLKCDDQKPCRRCVKRNLECHWPQDERTPDAVDSQGKQVHFISCEDGRKGLVEALALLLRNA